MLLANKPPGFDRIFNITSNYKLRTKPMMIVRDPYQVWRLSARAYRSAVVFVIFCLYNLHYQDASLQRTTGPTVTGVQSLQVVPRRMFVNYAFDDLNYALYASSVGVTCSSDPIISRKCSLRWALLQNGLASTAIGSQLLTPAANLLTPIIITVQDSLDVLHLDASMPLTLYPGANVTVEGARAETQTRVRVNVSSDAPTERSSTASTASSVPFITLPANSILSLTNLKIDHISDGHIASFFDVSGGLNILRCYLNGLQPLYAWRGGMWKSIATPLILTRAIGITHVLDTNFTWERIQGVNEASSADVNAAPSTAPEIANTFLWFGTSSAISQAGEYRGLTDASGGLLGGPGTVFLNECRYDGQTLYIGQWEDIHNRFNPVYCRPQAFLAMRQDIPNAGRRTLCGVRDATRIVLCDPANAFPDQQMRLSGITAFSQFNCRSIAQEVMYHPFTSQNGFQISVGSMGCTEQMMRRSTLDAILFLRQLIGRSVFYTLVGTGNHRLTALVAKVVIESSNEDLSLVLLKKRLVAKLYY